MKRFVLIAGLSVVSAAILAANPVGKEAASAAKPAAAKQNPSAKKAVPKKAPAKAALPPVKPATAAEVKKIVAANKGKVVLVNFWATWCLGCVEEFPHLVKLQRKYAKQGLVVVFVSGDDAPDVPTKVQPFLRQNGATGSFLIKGNLSDFIEQFEPGLEAAFDFPRNYLYDKDGKQVEVFGQVDTEAAENKIKPLL